MRVNYFQRRPRPGYNFSLETFYQDIRHRLNHQIEQKVYLSKFYNDGFLSKLINIIEAGIRQGRDVNHITGEVHFLNLLMKKNKVVLTILDCGMILRKKGLAKKIIKMLYMSFPIKKACIVIAISEVTKKEIVSYTNCDPNKIKVIPVPISSDFIPCPKEFNEEKPVVLQVGTAYNKNVTRLIEALKGINCHLSIIGRLSEEDLSLLHKNKIDFSNEYNISKERLIQKYQECDLLSFISTFEGFGMPIVEAQMVERIVITGNISSMPEVAGGGACLVDPFNISDIRRGVLKIIRNKEFRSNLISLGRMNRARFDGGVIAEMYLEIYKKCASGAYN